MGYQKIFFSYSRVDGEKAALKLAGDLRKFGANVWIDQSGSNTGTLAGEEIEKTIETSDCILFIATPKSTSSNNVLSEVYYALEENKHVISIILESCDLPFRLKSLQHIDFTVDYDLAFERLLEALNLDRNSISTEEKPFLIKDSEDINEENKSWTENTHGKQLKEELLWSKLSNINTVQAYNEYLIAYPQGKFRERAIKKIDELNQIGKEASSSVNSKEAEQTEIRKRERHGPERKITTGKIGKRIGIGVAAFLLIAVASYFIFTNWYNPGKDESTYSLLNSSDSIKKADESSLVSPEQQPLPVNENNSETTNSEPASDNSGSQIENQPSQIEGSNSSTLDFDETINERIIGSWYEADNTPVNGLTSLMAQTYYRNGTFEAVSTFKNESGVVVFILSYSGNWRVKNGEIYEEVTASSDPKSLEVGYNQTSQITSITNQTIDYIDTKGVQRKMFRLQL